MRSFRVRYPACPACGERDTRPAQGAVNMLRVLMAAFVSVFSADMLRIRFVCRHDGTEF